MPLITLLHTGPPYTTGTVIRSTHPDFVQHQEVEVSWPLTLNTGPGVSVILSAGNLQYLARWTDPFSAVQLERSYASILKLPITRRLRH